MNENILFAIIMAIATILPLFIGIAYAIYRRIAYYERKLDKSWRIYEANFLKECPLCKSKDIALKETIIFPKIIVNASGVPNKIYFPTYDINSNWKIYCKSCGCSSSEFSGISEVIDNWNNRTERIEDNGIQ